MMRSDADPRGVFEMNRSATGFERSADLPKTVLNGQFANHAPIFSRGC